MADPISSIGGLSPRSTGFGAPIAPRPVGVPRATGLSPTGLSALPAPGAKAAQTQQQADDQHQQQVAKALANPDLPSWAKDALVNPSHRRSIAQQVGGVFSGLIPGAVHMVKEAAVTLAGPVRAATDLFRGKLAPADFLNMTDPRNMLNDGTPADQALWHKYVPLAQQVVHGGEQTAGRIAQLSPWEVRSIGGHHVNTYGDAYRQGDIVNTVLGDVGNAAVVAGPIAEGLGLAGRVAEGAGAPRLAAGLGKAGDIAGVVSRVGGRAGNAPIEAVGGVLKGAKSMWRAAGEAAAAKLGEVLPTEGLASFPMQTSELGKLSKATAKEAMNAPGNERRFMEKNLGSDAGLGHKATTPSMLEQEVGLTRAAGVAQAHQMIVDQLGPDAALASHVAREEPGVTPTLAGQDLAAQYHAGTLPPEQMARIDAVTEAYKKQAAAVTQNALEGTGLLKGKMDPAYTGDEPIPRQLDLALAEAGARPQVIKAMHDALDQGATLDDLKAHIPELAGVLLNPDIYPKLWREAMNVTAKGTEAGAVDLPRTPQEMLAAGMERPTYMPTTKSKLGQPRAPAIAPTTSGLSSGLRGVANERHSATMGTGPYSLATAAEGLGKNIATTKFNSIVQRYIADNRVPTAGDILGRAGVDVNALQAEAERFVTASERGGLSKAGHADEVQKEYGRLINAHLQEQGYEVLPGDRANPQAGDFNPAKAAQHKEINPNSVVLPKGIKDAMVRYHTGATTNKALAVNREINKSFKRNVLAFNVHWTAGDALRNQLIGWVGGGVNPVSMGKAMIDVGKMAPEIKDEIFNRSNFTAQGMRAQEAKMSPTLEQGSDFGRAPARTTLGRGVRAVQDKSFQLNAAVNKIQREGWSMVKLERELKARGLSSTSDLGSDLDKWHDPAVQKAINDTVNESNKLFGTLDEMSPFERRVMTQVFPFWGWMRHVTMLAARTAVDNPARMLWTLRLGAVGMNTSPQDMPAYLGGSLGMGSEMSKHRLGAVWANPFFDIGTGGLLTPGMLGKSLSPAIKFGVTALTNRDANIKFNTVTHAPRTHPNPFASAAYQALTTVPWMRGAASLAPTVDVPGLGYGLGPVKRYGSGQPEMSKVNPNQPLSSGPRWRAALGMVSAPVPNTYVPVRAVGTAAPAPLRRSSSKGLKRVGLSGGLKHVGLNG